MIITTPRFTICKLISVLLLWALNVAPVCAGAPVEGGAADNAELLPIDNKQIPATPVAFPGSMSMPNAVQQNPVNPSGAYGARAATPTVTGAPLAPTTLVPVAAKRKMMISQMNGEVHFKHLQAPQIDPGRALYIETGSGNSWCECKLSDCTTRIWCDSQLSVFPDANVFLLKKGSLIMKVDRGTESTYSIIAGDLMCRVQSTTLRVQCTEKSVSFQVAEGTITVFNRKTGEIFRAGQVTQAIR